MNNNFDLLACSKTLSTLGSYYSEKILGMGACTYHTMGYLLIEAYLKGDPEVKKFVDMLIKNFNDKRKSSNKRLYELFEWVDIEKYPVEALGYNKICYNGIYWHLGHKTFNGIKDKDLWVGSPFEFAVSTLKRFMVDAKTGLPKKQDQFGNKNDLTVFKNENKVLVKLTNGKYEVLPIEKIIYYKKREIEFKYSEQEKKKLQEEINELEKPFEIKYDFDLDFLDGDSLNINYEGLPGDNYDEWQHYRICNWIGQMFRMYMNEHGEYKNKLKLPFKMQKPKDVVKEYAIVAKKTKKPFISVHSAEEGYLLYIIDNKKFKPKLYMFDIQNPEIHVYDYGTKMQLDKKEVEDLLNQVIEFSKCDPFCSSSNDMHIQPIINHKKRDYLEQVTSVLKYIAEHEKKRSLITKVLFVVGCVTTAGLLYLGFYIVNSVRLIYKLKHQKEPKYVSLFPEGEYITAATLQLQRCEKNIDDKEENKKSDYQTQKEKLEQLKQLDENKDKKKQKEKGNDEHQK